MRVRRTLDYSILPTRFDDSIRFLEPLYFYAAENQQAYLRDCRLDRLIRKMMEKYQIMTAKVTNINIQRLRLITKEEMEFQSTGNVIFEDFNKERVVGIKQSANDDLESLFEHLRCGTEYDKFVYTNYLPMLTNEEKKLAEEKDSSYMATLKNSPDIVFEIIPTIDFDLISESKSKFVRGVCCRDTCDINLDLDISLDLEIFYQETEN